MKKCRYCGESIQEYAIKCRYCNEWLGQNNKQIIKVKIINSVFFLIAVLVTIVGIIIVAKVYYKNLIDTKNSTGSIRKKDVSCHRKIPYETAPEFERAISLLSQRVNQWVSYSGDSLTNTWVAPFIFGTKYRNCVNISYSDDSIEEEGYFTFNTKSTPENINIIVSKKYKSYDDILTALLLVHEFTHAQQFIDNYSGENSRSCIQKEVYAFRAQWDFISILNEEEHKSLVARLKTFNTGSSTYDTLISLFELRSNIIRKCNRNDLNCIYTNLNNYLEEGIKKNKYYQKECSLD